MTAHINFLNQSGEYETLQVCPRFFDFLVSTTSCAANESLSLPRRTFNNSYWQAMVIDLGRTVAREGGCGVAVVVRGALVVWYGWSSRHCERRAWIR